MVRVLFIIVLRTTDDTVDALPTGKGRTNEAVGLIGLSSLVLAIYSKGSVGFGRRLQTGKQFGYRLIQGQK